MNTQPINTPDPGRPINVGSGGRARGDQPAELDPGMGAMLDKAAEALWHLRSDKGRYDIAPEVAMARTALSAAGVPRLVAEVERLRYDLDHSYSQREWSALTARATSAEQERDRLRAAIRALHQPRTYPSPDHSTAMVTYCVGCDEATGGHPCNTLALLAGSGEQAGEASTSVASPEFCKCQKPPHYPHRPAPVVPDGGHVLTEYGTTSCPVEIVRAEVVDGKCSACGAVVPDSPVDWQAHARAQVQAAEGDDTALRQIAASAVPGAVPDSADVRAVTIAALDAVQPTWRATGREPSEDDLAWTRAVLAVVGQGMTAEDVAAAVRPVADAISVNECRKLDDGHQHPADECPAAKAAITAALDALGIAVRPTGQEQADG